MAGDSTQKKKVAVPLSLWAPNKESTIMIQLSISCKANRNAFYLVFIIVI